MERRRENRKKKKNRVGSTGTESEGRDDEGEGLKVRLFNVVVRFEGEGGS